MSHRNSFTSVDQNLDSLVAIKEALELPCYRDARSIVFTADKSLEQLRCHALHHGKKVLVATTRLRRGFKILDPYRIPDDEFELASSVEGLESDGMGRSVTLAQVQDEGFTVDLMVFGSGDDSVQEERVRGPEQEDVEKILWMTLVDRKVLLVDTPVVMVADERHLQPVGLADQTEGQITHHMKSLHCDYLVTAKRVFQAEKATRSLPPQQWLEKVDKQHIHAMPPLQELKGIKLMEKIMGEASPKQETESKAVPDTPPAETQLGIDIVSRIMKGYRA